jgi:uncharacterized protein (DUF1810 family)
VSESFDLERFVRAQDAGDAYAFARAEIASGEKRSHWIWYVFPQIAGLGRSDMSRRYAVANLDEARAFLAHTVLGGRLREITALANQLAPKSARDIFSGDEVKFHSCVTLFSLSAPEDLVFREALNLFFDGELDEPTVAILSAQGDL